jgi:hypothetical protein
MSVHDDYCERIEQSIADIRRVAWTLNGRPAARLAAVDGELIAAPEPKPQRLAQVLEFRPRISVDRD